MRIDILVRKPFSNGYSIDVVPRGATEKINKNGYFYYYEQDKHLVILGQDSLDLEDEHFRCVAVAHNPVELQRRLKEEIEDHVTRIWEDNRRRGIDGVIDQTGEDILSDWRKPVVMPDD